MSDESWDVPDPEPSRDPDGHEDFDGHDDRVFLCCVCGAVPVDALAGHDTCQECLDRQ